MNGLREITRAGRASSSLSKNNKSTPEASREYTLKFTPFPTGVAPNGELWPRFALPGTLRLLSLIGWAAINCTVPSRRAAPHHARLVRPLPAGDIGLIRSMLESIVAACNLPILKFFLGVGAYSLQLWGRRRSPKLRIALYREETQSRQLQSKPRISRLLRIQNQEST